MPLFAIHRFCKLLFLAAALLTGYRSTANEGGGIVARAVLDGSLNQVKTDSSRTVEDSAFFNYGSSGYLDTAYKVNNLVTLKINEATDWWLKTDFTVTVKLRIIYSNGTSTDSITRDFTINYDSVNAYNSRSSFVFSGGRRVTVKIISISSNVSSWDVSRVLLVENQLTAKPAFIFSCTNTVTSITVHPPTVPNPDELLVSWTNVRGADAYDLEWTYIDSTALGRYNPNSNRSGLFLHNASRITTTGNSYSIPLLYDNGGALYVRVRPIKQGARNSVIPAIWSTDAGTAVMGSFGFYGHERPLNWQSTISFAEEGKRKVVVQYFDGGLKGRQTVTKDNTTQRTVVAENYYDYQGRPTIQVMPAPSLSNIVQYTASFNVGINGTEYSASSFDTLYSADQFCNAHADSLSNISGAANYYSPNNPLKGEGMNQFIPDAENYPFTETEYLPDNTGRISRQGGVGKNYQLGSGHETKYYYGTPDQAELDALFGTEVGNRSHYFKNMIRDANGQYSVSYIDMRGRTIATALAGNTPAGMDALPSNIGSMITETLSDSGSVILDDLSMISQKSMLVPMADTFHFNYLLDPAALGDTNCQSLPVCYSCRYDLQITITDNCNNQTLPGGKAFDTLVRNFQFSSLSADCGQPNLPMQLSFPLYLSEGSYLITKKLSINKDAYFYYRDSVYLPGNTCVSMQQYLEEQRTLVALSNPTCVTTCTECKESVGTLTAFRNSFMEQSGLSPADTAAFRNDINTAYKNAMSACNKLCGDSLSVGADLRSMMLQDMTPPYGQYADTNRVKGDKYSIFFERPTGVEDNNHPPVYKLDEVIYQDASGYQDSVYNLESDRMILPNQLTMSQFTQNFRGSWAEALLPYHPEYCKLQALEANRPAIWWNQEMEAVQTFREARDKGYLNPSANSNYPFPANAAFADPQAAVGAAWRGYIEDRILNYLPAAGGNPTLNMWAMACIMTKCEAADPSCISFYTSATNWFDTNTLCEGDLDMAWKNFRQLYLNVKQDILNKITTTTTGCTPRNPAYTTVPTAAALYAVEHTPVFNEETRKVIQQNSMDYMLQAANNTAAASQAYNKTQAELSKYYDENSSDIVHQWTLQLAPCQYNAAHLRDTIIPRLQALCRMACDEDHPYGASSLPAGKTYTPPGTAYVFRSFRDIIEAYNEAHGIDETLTCNAELLNTPKAYGNQSAWINKPVYSKPSDCECQLINDLYNTYMLSGQGDYSFAAYLKRTQQIEISNEDLNLLRSLCNTPAGSNCTWLPKAILLPPSMQCNTGTVCTTCTIVDSLYQKFTVAYEGKVPQQITDPEDSTQLQINQLFQNFMNNRLGFSLQAWEYIQFRETCANHTSVIYDSLHCQDKPIGNLYLSDQSASLSDIRPLSSGGYILAGSIQQPGGTTDANITRTDQNGNILWSKRAGGLGNDRLHRIKPAADGGFIGIGTTHSSHHTQGEMMVIKLDASGNTSWTKTIGFNTTYGERGYDIVTTSDGGYAALGIYNEHSGAGEFVLSKLDTGGNISWTHKFGTARLYYSACGDNDPDTISYDGSASFSLLEQDDTLFVAGTAYDLNMGNRYYGVVHRVGSETGELYSSWHYAPDNAPSTSIRFNDIQAVPGGFLVGATTADRLGTTDQQVAVVKLNGGGQVLSYKQFTRPAGSTRVSSSGILASADGTYLVGQTGNSSPHIYWQRVDASGNQLWASETSVPGSKLIGRLASNGSSGFAVAGTNNSQAMLLTLQQNSPTNCYDNTVNLGLSSPAFSRVNWVLEGSQQLMPLFTDTLFAMAAVTVRDSSLLCRNNGSCYMVYEGPRLCGKAAPLFPGVKVDSSGRCADSTFFAVSKSTELFRHYKDSLTGAFEQKYNEKCLQAYRYESFTVTHARREYHYTLYYYDQAGNLVKTIPPAGVKPNDDPSWLAQVKAARKNKQVLMPAHEQATTYRYNTINKMVAQKSPDGGLSRFWYDRLGRLAISQNAMQEEEDHYSYTLYDSIGRIVQAGQLSSATAISNLISRNPSSLQSWLNAAANTAEQITKTNYDYPYEPLEPVLAATNLRSRVSWTAIYSTAADLDTNGMATATYYSYDNLGNIDTLIQDYRLGVMANNGNRFKKLVYQYDLVSGKVNQVAYQPGQPDAFYHRYHYDAENRITHVLTSRDSINWDNDAFYSYYLHGPLARAVLGEQQVQGINYTYSLQGWLKSVNPDVHQGSGYLLEADGSSGSNIAAPALQFTLNYYNNDYLPISGANGPAFGSQLALGTDNMPLYNGNISSMAVNIGKLEQPLLYNYKYDQLNRLKAMDAWHKKGNSWSDIVKVPDFQERVSYDPNGNIMGYKRQGNNTFAGNPLGMDSLRYHYIPGTNKLDHITDTVPAGNYVTDIDSQPAGNYRYDAIGNLIADSAENISRISWTVYGKINSIHKKDGSVIWYTYDASGNRISKQLISDTGSVNTWYTRDAQGNIISVYISGQTATFGGDLTQTELSLYGSTQMGIISCSTNVQQLAPIADTTMPLLGNGFGIIFERANKYFELNNHLGNILATVSDKKLGRSLNDSTVDHFVAQVMSAQDYYPFGMLMAGRHFRGIGYRYGFNGQEMSNEIKGFGNSYTAEFWEYDPRVARRWNLDPKPTTGISQYSAFNNSPILLSDPLGDTSGVGTRVVGGLKVVGGLLEMGVGAAGGVASSWTGVGAVVGGGAVLHGADVTSAGWMELWTGKETKTFTQRAINSGLKALGVPSQKSELIADYTDAGISIMLSSGAGIAKDATIVSKPIIQVAKTEEVVVQAESKVASMAAAKYPGLAREYAKQTVSQLRSTIRKTIKTIQEHEELIKNPFLKVSQERWDAMTEAGRNGLINKWKGDIERNKQYLEIAQDLLVQKIEQWFLLP